jgi:hypothetical protein
MIKRYIAIVLIAILIAGSYACIGSRATKRYRNKRELSSIYTYASDLPVFLKSLNEFDSDHILQRVKYHVMHFLLKESVEGKGEDSREYALLQKLYELDVHTRCDSVDAIFRIAFKNLDPEPGPPNEFIEEELTRRSEFLLSFRCFHVDWTQPLDQLAKDVIRIGIPDLESFDEVSFDFYFPQVNLARHYVCSPKSGYLAGPPPVEIVCGDTVPPDRRYFRPPEDLRKEEMRKIKDKVYVLTPYASLKRILIRPFIFPSHCENSWDGINPYGRGEWLCTRAGIDVFGDLDEILKKDTVGKVCIDLIVKYVISDPVTQKIITHDSARFYREVASTELADGFHVRFFSEPFHTKDSENLLGNSTYLLDVSVASVKKILENGNFDLKRSNISFEYILPRDTIQIPHYNTMFAEKAQTEHKYMMNHFVNILPFKPGRTISRGDTVNIWLPLTDLRYSSADAVYHGYIDLLLVRKSSATTKVDIIDESIQFFMPGETPQQFLLNLWQDSIPKIGPEPIAVDTIISTTPNIYHNFTAIIPKNIDRADDYVLMAFIYYRDFDTGQIKTIATASLYVCVK